ncbi:MAG: methylmalonyl Co-A mutase-associated GTPase MeaB [Flavobacteriales bacterium]|nr:methylmalonyl Co-A mutase-associated GTPase MeaB [Flavobacteriales bacterium]
MDAVQLLKGISGGEPKALARAISVVENDGDAADMILRSLSLDRNVPVVGFTGPPGAGKSTLINEVVKQLTGAGKRIGVVAIDPSSPFNMGALLGDRIRMSEHFENDLVFIRSLASRRSLGGLSAKTMEVVDVMRGYPFDYILIETVGVGQSEVEIAGLADTTVLVLVPEAGDEIQTLKSGVMEIADIFVVNKADRPGAEEWVKNLVTMTGERYHDAWQPPVVKTVAMKGDGVEDLVGAINDHHAHLSSHDVRKAALYTEKAWNLIQVSRMNDVDKAQLEQRILEGLQKGPVNLYAELRKWGYINDTH